MIDAPWITAGAALLGVAVGYLGQWVLFRQKYGADSKDRTRADKARFSTDVFLYLRFISDIEEAEKANPSRRKAVALSAEQRADLSARYRAVISSTHALITSADADLVEQAEEFLKQFADYAYAHRRITTGRNGKYETQETLQELARNIRTPKP